MSHRSCGEWLSLGRRISSIRRYQILLGEILSALFPSAIAWVDFMFIWVFLLTTIYNAQIHKPIQTVIAGLGTLYCLNEWDKRINRSG